MTDYNNFTVETDADGIALVTWDMPGRSMNVFTEEVMDELDKIVDQVAGDDTIKGAVITSGKESFLRRRRPDHAAAHARRVPRGGRRRTTTRPSRCCSTAPAA